MASFRYVTCFGDTSNLREFTGEWLTLHVRAELGGRGYAVTNFNEQPDETR